MRVLRRHFASLASPRPQNLVEKIVQRHAVGLAPGQRVYSGDFCYIRPQHVMTHDNTAAVMKKFDAIGAHAIHDARQPVFTLDHDIQNTSPQNMTKYQRIQEFAQRHGVDFYPAGRGIGHQIMIEEGYAFPYTLTVASDSHSNTYGGIGALGTPIVRTDAASIWATGKTWWQIPSVIRVDLVGKPDLGVVGKDVIIALCGLFNQDDVLNAAIEFGGNGVRHLTVDDRLAIANMTTEWGALAGVFPVDDLTASWLKRMACRQEALHGKPHPRINLDRISAITDSPIGADNGAVYAKRLTLDLSTMRDHYVSGPDAVKVATPISILAPKRIAVDKAYLVSCTNSRLSDLKQAADVFTRHANENGQLAKVAPGVELYVSAASALVQQDAEDAGVWKTLIDAGAKPLPPGCGPCIGLGTGLLEDGQVGISASNRNFKGRMGSRNAQVYLSSPSVVASSAIAGYICSLDELNSQPALAGDLKHSITQSDESPAASSQPREVLDGFPHSLTGQLLFCPADNINTDGIYPGKYTYRDDLTPDEMKAVVMENYDAKFATMVAPGSVLVAGANFGTGSSREQAATALKYAGIQMVLAESFSETFKRNAFNNALICAEAPALVRDLRQHIQKGESAPAKTYPLAMPLHVDFANVSLTWNDCSYAFTPIGKAAQQVITEGGLEQWIKSQLSTSARAVQ